MNTRTFALFLSVLSVTSVSARRNIHENIRSFTQDMTEWIEESRKEMQESFDSLKNSVSMFADSYQSGVELSFETADDQLHVHIQLPHQVTVDTQEISAEMEDDSIVIHIPYDHGQLDVDVTESVIDVMSKQAMKKSSDQNDKEKKADYRYTAQSQMTQSLPARIVPSSIKKKDTIVVDHDEKLNILTLKFDKKQRSEKVHVKKQNKADSTEKDAQENASD